MIQINQIKMPLKHTEEDLKEKAAKLLRVRKEDLLAFKIVRQSLDARKKEQLHYSYCVQLKLAEEAKRLVGIKIPGVQIVQEFAYVFPGGSARADGVQAGRARTNETQSNEIRPNKAQSNEVRSGKGKINPLRNGIGNLHKKPVIIGSGPAGLFCGLMLARHGYAPILLERGEDVDTRTKKVADFWAGGTLDPLSNVQFGEGGAGTFSDGKVKTLVKDPAGRNRLVMEIFAEFGADPAICYQQKPHLGTDILSQIVKNIREEIRSLGGEVRFASQVTELLLDEGRITGVVVNGKARMEADEVVLAVGHSARDTFAMLDRLGVPMEAKAFAVGFRIQHPQEGIDRVQYHMADASLLGAASYKLTGPTGMDRGIYSFCMCPGGFVVNASSEPGRLTVNGMSYHDRAGVNANSALIVAVNPMDFPGNSPLSGVRYQQMLEETAYQIGGGRIPVQLYGDFRAGAPSTGFGAVTPQFKGDFAFANLRVAFPTYLGETLVAGMAHFGRAIAGFDREDAILAGIESRTSSPLRILRDQGYESAVKGLFPCGEGAGYAGGITSAAMDGIRVAEEIARRHLG